MTRALVTTSLKVVVLQEEILYVSGKKHRRERELILAKTTPVKEKTQGRVLIMAGPTPSAGLLAGPFPSLHLGGGVQGWAPRVGAGRVPEGLGAGGFGAGGVMGRGA